MRQPWTSLCRFALVAGLTALTMLGTTGCGVVSNDTNPLSASSAPATPESLDAVGAMADTVLPTDTFALAWTSPDSSVTFSYRLDTTRWSPWNSSVQIESLLDDGNHTIDVQWERDGVRDTLSKAFTVAALESPALYLFPRTAQIAGDSVIVRLRCEGLPDAYALHVAIDGATIRASRHLLSDRSNVVYLADTRTVNIALGPESAPISGSMDLVELVLDAPAGAEAIQISLSDLSVRRDDRSEIPLSMVRGSLTLR